VSTLFVGIDFSKDYSSAQGLDREGKRNLQEMRCKEIRYTMAINERCFYKGQGLETLSKNYRAIKFAPSTLLYIAWSDPEVIISLSPEIEKPYSFPLI
jgi:hypothetical protein